ncbi:MFS transporter [Escherichia coli]
MFALAREHADKTGREAVMFSSFTRSGFTGMGHWPTAGLCLSDGFQLYGNVSERSGSIYCLRRDGVAVFTVDAKRASRWRPARLKRRAVTVAIRCCCFVICTLMWGSNSLYIINMPLFIINELHLPEKLAGVMMGTAAGLEIPTMLIAGYFAKRLGKRFLMRVAAVGGVCFYAGMLMAHSPVILLGLQLLNAIFIGILGGIGMLYFQDLMPGQAGSATTLYTNTSRVGWIIAGSVAGIVAEIWNYHAVFWFSMVMIIATLFCLLRIKDV